MASISRRDFLNGVALTIATGLTPSAQLAAQPTRTYPPALMGMRGHHEGAFETAHALALEGRTFAADRLPVEESYDLVIVGAGISGLAAAWYYRRRNPRARILILDNHDDFGGHAKRNEFTMGGRLLIGYGGSEAIQSPRNMWSPVAKALLRDLGVDVTRFERAFDRRLYQSLGLGRGLFFDREAFGRDVLVPGDASGLSGDDETRKTGNARPLSEFVAAFPLSAEGKAQFLALYDVRRDPLAGKSTAEKLRLLKSTSYRDFLIKICGCSEEVANCFQGRPLGFFGLGADAVPAFDVRTLGYPGFAGLGLPPVQDHGYSEPYIYHFPDGNASLARLLVRALVPGVAPGKTMDDVVLAPFDYGKLDVAGRYLRIRLNATCVNVHSGADGASIAYVRGDKLHRVAARHVVLACFNMIIPHIMPQLPQAQRTALAQNVKAPLVYTNVVIRDWRAWMKLGVHDISAPMSFHNRVKLDFPVGMGGYRNPRDPKEPIVVHMVHVPGAPNQGVDSRTQFRVGRGQLLGMTFADFEERIRDDLDRMLGTGGFSSARDIAAITVNRWSHGYGYVENSLFDSDDYQETVQIPARRKFGRKSGSVAIANADSEGDAYAHLAIDAAARAVVELME